MKSPVKEVNFHRIDESKSSFNKPRVIKKVQSGSTNLKNIQVPSEMVRVSRNDTSKLNKSIVTPSDMNYSKLWNDSFVNKIQIKDGRPKTNIHQPREFVKTHKSIDRRADRLKNRYDSI
jgi:hypothetical protein